MVQVFAKRFWGFDPATWPIIAFGLEGNRDGLLRESRPGDLVAFIGTKGPPTAVEEQGRFLGLAEIGRSAIDSLSVLNPEDLDGDAYDARGRFKWPKAIPMLRAWRFLARPLVTELLGWQFTYEATVRTVLLDEESRGRVLGLQREEATLPDLEVLRRHRVLIDATRRTGPTTGPVPSSWSGTISRDASSEATVYAFRFGSLNVWKIGHAQDVASRLAEVNRHVPFEALGQQWTLAIKQGGLFQTDAYDLEQRVLGLLTTKRTEGERVVCSEQELQTAWIGALAAPR
jgi:hypothetical protein